MYILFNYLDENEECLDNQQTKEETESLDNKANNSEDHKIFTVGIVKDEISSQSNKDGRLAVWLNPSEGPTNKVFKL